MQYFLLTHFLIGLISFSFAILIAKKINVKLNVSLVQFVSFCLTALLLEIIAVNTNLSDVIRKKVDPSAEVVDSTGEKVQKLFSDEHTLTLFQQATEGKAPGEIQSMMEILARDGMKRLSTKELFTWNEVRLEISKKSTEACSKFWLGGIKDKELLSVVGSLSSELQDKWAAISTNAMRMELQKVEYGKATKEDVLKGFLFIKDIMPPAEQIRFAKTIQGGSKINSEDACWAMKKVMGGVNEIPQHLALNLLKYFAGSQNNN